MRFPFLQKTSFRLVSQMLTGSSITQARFGTAIASLNDISQDGFKGKHSSIFILYILFYEGFTINDTVTWLCL